MYEWYMLLLLIHTSAKQQNSQIVQKIKDQSTFKFADTQSCKNVFYESHVKCYYHNKIKKN